MEFDKNSAIHPEDSGRKGTPQTAHTPRLKFGAGGGSSDSQMTCIRSGIDLLYANEGKLFGILPHFHCDYTLTLISLLGLTREKPDKNKQTARDGCVLKINCRSHPGRPCSSGRINTLPGVDGSQ